MVAKVIGVVPTSNFKDTRKEASNAKLAIEQGPYKCRKGACWERFKTSDDRKIHEAGHVKKKPYSEPKITTTKIGG